MFCKVCTAACIGIDGHIVQVEADLSQGLPSFRIVGEISTEVRESGARICTAIRNSGYTLPPKRYVVNLSPADFRKSGTGFDFPIAIALLCCIEQINPQYLEKSIFIGELGLNGNLVPVKGILSMVGKASEQGFEQCYVPEGNVKEAVIIPGIRVYGIRSLREVILYLQGKKKIEETIRPIQSFSEKRIKYPLDYKDIYGQEMAKRCIQISAAGGHHLLMIGPPGSGKTMMAERMPYILPKMTLDEQITVTKIYSIRGLLKTGQGLVEERPFRRPHHTVSDKVLIGGGGIPVPGEISMAHAGVLFLDEFAEFSRSAIESLRQPLESGEVYLHRVRGDYCFPAKPLVVAAMNPCKCGYYPDRERCQCTMQQIQSYMSKISGPIMERIDLCVRVNPVDYACLSKPHLVMSSEDMFRGIIYARRQQEKRFLDYPIHLNSEMTPAMTETFCRLDKESQEFLQKAYERYHLSARSYQKILKVARTICDLDGEEIIQKKQAAEALCYRLPNMNHGGAL